MRTTPEQRRRLWPSGIPLSAADQAEWDALSEEERLAIFNEMLDDPESNTVVEDTMDDIRRAAKARIAARQGAG